MDKVSSVWRNTFRQIILGGFAFALVVPPIGVKREDSRARRGKAICSRDSVRMPLVSAIIIFGILELQ